VTPPILKQSVAAANERRGDEHGRRWEEKRREKIKLVRRGATTLKMKEVTMTGDGGKERKVGARAGEVLVGAGRPRNHHDQKMKTNGLRNLLRQYLSYP